MRDPGHSQFPEKPRKYGVFSGLWGEVVESGGAWRGKWRENVPVFGASKTGWPTQEMKITSIGFTRRVTKAGRVASMLRDPALEAPVRDRSGGDSLL